MLLAHMWLLAGAIMRPALRPPSCSSAARCASPLSCATAAVEDAVDDDAPPLLRVLRAGGLDAAQAQEVYERRPPGKLPGAVRQELLLEWVQRELLCVGMGVHPENYCFMLCAGAAAAHCPPATADGDLCREQVG